MESEEIEADVQERDAPSWAKPNRVKRGRRIDRLA
jgi:hypothetical protein